ncbi:MAG: proteasome-activating nucleotidase [Candidatus Woesearchaeota archaeon]|jgi:proteasome regulatory subunit
MKTNVQKVPESNSKFTSQASPQPNSTSNQNLSALEQENRILRETVFQLKIELDRYRAPALMLAEIADMLDKNAIIKLPNGNKFLVNVSSSAKDLKPGDMVTVEQKNLTVIEKIERERKVEVEQFVIIEQPHVTWEEIGGLKDQENELKEVVELPLTKPELFKKVGITPPKGILLYGPPGTGKTLLAKAVASSTNSTFIEIVGSELVQKFIGEGAKLVKDIFKLARERAPSIIFIDEIDAIAAKRIDIGTSGEREVQRTFMQFLAEIDGFKPLDNVKIIGCTNRRDILDPAILRPGRLDRLIEVPAPNKEGLKQILKIHSKNMNFDKKMNEDKILKLMDGFSGAEVKSVCTEAGYFAIRENRTKIIQKDIEDAIKKVKRFEEEDKTGYIGMFG